MNHKLKIDDKDVLHLQYINMERGFSHYPHNEDMLQYEYLRDGNLASVEESSKMFQPEKQGHLSDDPIRNLKYLFVVNTALASRFAVEGGLPLETSYAISDLYIQKMDRLYTAEEICLLRQEMFAHYTSQVALAKKEKVFSKPIIQCLAYIDAHLHENLHLSDLATYVHLNPTYLSTLFKNETSQTFSAYITKTRIETAKNMLKNSEYSYTQISSALSFSSQSHFTKVFREQTGYTPKKYRMLFFGQSISNKNSL